MRADRRDSPFGRLAWGGMLLTAGVIFWLDRMGRIEARDYFEWWPVALVFVGLAHLLDRRWSASAVWIGIGVFFAMPLFGLPELPIWKIFAIWPLLFTVAGVVLILHALRRPEKARAGNAFRSFAMMGAHNRVVPAEGLAGGEAVAVMAGCEIELAPPRSSREDIVIEVLAFWGGIELRVPPGWRVTNRVTEILGGVEDKTIAPRDGAPHVVIRGAVIMGGVEVKNSTELAV